jgi:Mrp family chromosome partitioning ATPase
MDRIRKALDLARLERSRPADTAAVPVLHSVMPVPQSDPAAAHALPRMVASPPYVRLADPPSVAARTRADLDDALPPATDAVAAADLPPGPGSATGPGMATGPGIATGYAPSTPIAYTHTRVFTPASDVLERNRILNPESHDRAAVAFRMLRTQVLQRMDARGWRSLAIFSPRERDGKTTTAINLAVSLAHDRLHTVLLVDFDFKHPTLAERLGFSPEFGADDALCGRAALRDCLYHPEGFERLVVLPARMPLRGSSELLAGRHSRELVAELRARYPERIILYDLPPVLSADDALSFAPLIECGLVVASEGRTRRADLVRTVELLHKTPLVGTVLNRAAETQAS